MQTFEQFYYKFLAEAKYFPFTQTHDPENRFVISAQGEDFNIEQNGMQVGTIVPNPPNRYILNGRGNINAALGVSSNIPGNRPKIYAFHLAKNRLAAEGEPGARPDNIDDYRFFEHTYNSTADMLLNFIGQHGRDNVSVVVPFSTNNFNTRVLRAAGVLNSIEVEKYTYNEAHEHKWNNHDNVLRCINNFKVTNRNSVLVYAILRFLGSNQGVNLVQNANLENGNRKISLEKLAGIITSIVNNNGQLYQNFYTYITHVLLHERKFTQDETNTIIPHIDPPNQRRVANGRMIRLTKSWLLGDLKSVYFKDIPANIDLKPYVAVVDDNINSSATYDSVNNKLRARRNDIVDIQWFVGIVPLRTTPPTPAEEMQQQAAQEAQRADQNAAAQAAQQVERAAVRNAVEVIRDNKEYSRIFAGTGHNTTEAIRAFTNEVRERLNTPPANAQVQFLPIILTANKRIVNNNTDTKLTLKKEQGFA